MSEKISFSAALAMVDHVILVWALEHQYVSGGDEKKSAEEWAEEFCKNLKSTAEIGPEAQSVYVHALMEKIMPGSNFLGKCDALKAKRRMERKGEEN